MFPCGLCKDMFSSNDDLRDHLEGHKSQMLQENEIKREQDSDREFDQHSYEEGLLLVCVKEEQLQEQQVEIKREEEPLRGQQEEIKNEEQHQEKQSEIKKEKVFGERTSAQARTGKKRLKLSTKTPSGPLECAKCSYKTKSERCFKVHMNQMHLNKYKCDHCPKRYPSKGSLSNHVQKEHLEVNLRLPEDERFRVTMKKKNQQKRQNFECPDFDQDSCEGSLILDFVKEEEHLQGQREETESEGDSEEFSMHVPFEKGAKNSSVKTFMCSECSYKTISKNKFKVHMSQMHLNEHKCDHCPKRFFTEGRLDNHLQKEHIKNEDKSKMPENEFFRVTMKKQDQRKEKYYECLKCTRQTRKRSAILQHIRGVHRTLLDELYISRGMELDDAGYHKCTKCFFKTLDKCNLRQHIKAVHEKRRDFICDLCKKAYPIKRYLLIHMKRVHSKNKPSKEDVEQLRCSKCSYKTINKGQFKHHMNQTHLNMHKCDRCPKRFTYESLLAKHIEKEHEKVEKPKLSEEEFFRVTMKDQDNQKRTLYECLKCTLQTENKSIIYRHIRGVHRKLLNEFCKSKGMVLDDDAGYHKCTECFFKTLRLAYLREHINAVHQTKHDYVCDLCKKVYSVKAYLFRHMKTVHIKKKYSSILHHCSICSYKTKYTWQLRIHKNVVHLKLREFTCDLCQIQFSRKNDLRVHIHVIHLKKKKILSCCCSFKTSEKRELSRHIQQVHRKIQGFSCKFCGKWYGSPAGLFLHKKNLHMSTIEVCKKASAATRFTCDLCKKTLKTRLSIYAHMKKMHLKKKVEF